MIAPSNLTAKAVSETQIDLAWKDNSTRESGFRVFQSRDDVNFNMVGAVGRNVVNFRVTGLSVATQYYFKVRAFKNTQISPFSNTANATTLGTVTPPPPPPPAPPGDGIASRYPGDVGIGNDPDVILADDFESYTDPSQLKPKWSLVTDGLRIASEPGNFYSGSKALEMTMQASSGEQLKECRLKLPVEQDILFFRAYTKFDPNFSVMGSSHNGLSIRAHFPGGSGTPAPADGTGFFLMALQNNATPNPLPGELQPGYHQIYAYWPKQRDGYGDHWFSDGWVRPGGNGLWLLNPSQYPDFKVMPRHQPNRGQWYCYEIMVKANTIGKNDGEVAWWIDGVLDGRITNLFLRSLDSLKMDVVRLTLHGTSSPYVQHKWYDNVVLAKKYIGPMVK